MCPLDFSSNFLLSSALKTIFATMVLGVSQKEGKIANSSDERRKSDRTTRGGAVVISKIKESRAVSPLRKGAENQHGRKGRAKMPLWSASEKLSKRYRPLSIPRLIPDESESGKALWASIRKVCEFSMIPASACVFAPCSGECLSKALSMRP